MKVCLRHGLRYQAAGTHKRTAGTLCFLSGAARRGPPKLFIILYSLFFQAVGRASALLFLLFWAVPYCDTDRFIV